MSGGQRIGASVRRRVQRAVRAVSGGPTIDGFPSSDLLRQEPERPRRTGFANTGRSGPADLVLDLPLARTERGRADDRPDDGGAEVVPLRRRADRAAVAVPADVAQRLDTLAAENERRLTAVRTAAGDGLAPPSSARWPAPSPPPAAAPTHGPAPEARREATSRATPGARTAPGFPTAPGGAATTGEAGAAPVVGLPAVPAPPTSPASELTVGAPEPPPESDARDQAAHLLPAPAGPAEPTPLPHAARGRRGLLEFGPLPRVVRPSVPEAYEVDGAGGGQASSPGVDRGTTLPS